MLQELENVSFAQLKEKAQRPMPGVVFDEYIDFLRRSAEFHITPERSIAVEVVYLYREPQVVDGYNELEKPYGANVSMTILYNGEARKHTVRYLPINEAHALADKYLPEEHRKCPDPLPA